MVAKVLRRFGIPTLVLAALASVVGFYDVLPEIGNTDSILQNGVFFLAAAYVPRANSDRWLGSGTWLRGAALAVVFLGGAVTALAFDQLANPAVALVLSVVGVAAAITIATLLPSTRVTRWIAEQIGARTIAIYVLHLPFLAALMYVLDSVSGPVAVIYPVVVGAVVVALCLLVFRLDQPIAPWLFDLPRRGRGGEDRPAATNRQTSAIE
ncbi:MAG: hypothetical protein INR66_01900 [Gordonia polyisoprenivorans]|nr:hypothetical protein [Gordonia polyisoprenivorans]